MEYRCLFDSAGAHLEREAGGLFHHPADVGPRDSAAADQFRQATIHCHRHLVADDF